MANLNHSIIINSKPEKVFKAITTEQGLKSWWTHDVKVDEVEKKYTFGFNNHRILFNMISLKEIQNEYVEWRCTGEIEEWKNTRLIFEISKIDPNSTLLRFTHADWTKIDDLFSKCNTDWGHLMYFLKEFAEGKNERPFMS
ncbi:SRPBCC domain-containing protein [Antarcticibacterium arcticum]|uniref:SRPBCC domain-containing protein n=1 Tax=Antarcticibacterium arcticum TaxID=2585771 RepID=A0A5B8YJQ9_9FLAO|nr:SRPBCC domain-containing protein [Antarcticibacterium arcticum]QED37358.1 SRPBCC domain-containing protein [Antarcticibacterium arcticum]